MNKNAQPYQQLKQQLDELLAKLQDPNVDIDEALKLHGEAMGLLKQLEKYLDSVELRINKIKQ